MSDYVQALRSKDETPGSLPAMTKEAEAAILDKYKEEIIAAQEGRYFYSKRSISVGGNKKKDILECERNLHTM